MNNLKEIKEAISKAIADLTGEQLAGFIAEVRAHIHLLNKAVNSQPIDHVKWVHTDEVQANDYNPNSVAKNEMTLLHTSISHDGYTQPIVTVFDPEINKYVIVDGFHRYSVMRHNADIQATTNNLRPIVVINKSINDRMAATVRHNRARGKHSVAGMSEMVFKMMNNGWDDFSICAEIGCSPDELLRLKHLTGFSKLFENAEFSQSWETRHQVFLRHQHQKKEKQNGSQNS